jgi:hypothetical protein
LAISCRKAQLMPNDGKDTIADINEFKSKDS